jgi:hypothetical protein
MKALGIGLATLLIVAAAASASFAADISPADRKAGMTAAPGLIQAGHVQCTLSDARMILSGTTDKGAKLTAYEVACTEGLGYVIEAQEKVAAPIVFDCLAADAPQGGKPSPVACKLPANANPAAGLTGVMAKTGRTCTVDKARYVGATADASIYETACHEGGGYILEWPKAAGAAPTASMCMLMTNSNIKCELTTPAQQTTVIDNLTAASGKACTVKDRRYIGSTPDHSDFFEVACTDGKGYMLRADATGKLQEALDCAKAINIGGGCTLTDARQAQTEQNAIYTDLSKKAGFDCQVSKYAEFPAMANNTEVVELACSNRPDGGVGIFPAQGKPQVFDCLRAETQGYKCSFSDPSSLYSKLSAQLRAKGKPSCVVSGARAYARTTTNNDLIEVACADGGPGWVIEYAAGVESPTDLLNCAQAANVGGGGCQLPTNKQH